MMLVLRIQGTLCIVGLLITSCQAEEIDITDKEEVIHCGSSPIHLKNPWEISDSEKDTVVYMEWIFKGNLKVAHFIDGQFVSKEPAKFEVFSEWGLTIKDPKPSDSGQYSAKLTLSTRNNEIEETVEVLVAEAPQLEGKSLMINETKDEKNISLACGRLKRYGTPPVELVWRRKSTNEEVNSTSSRGSQILTLPLDATGTYVCTVKSDFGNKCILPAEMEQFVTEKTLAGKETSGDDDGEVVGIAAGVAAVVVVAAAAVALIVVCRRRGKRNYKAGEATRKTEENQEGPPEDVPLHRSDDDVNVVVAPDLDEGRHPMERGSEGSDGPHPVPAPRTVYPAQSPSGSLLVEPDPILWKNIKLRSDVMVQPDDDRESFS